MKKFYVILFMINCYLSQSQIVNIPDPIFKSALINNPVVDLDNNGSGEADADLNNDGEIQVSEAEAVTSLNLYDLGISSLVGIEAFINLQRLDCEFNDLTNIDLLAPNSNLIYLDADGNNLTSFDFSTNTSIQFLYISGNQFSNLDLSQNTTLLRLGCSQNNNLTSLNIQNGNNTNMTRMRAIQNPNLTCIQVDNVAYANSQTCNNNIETGFCIDSIASFSENCNLSIEEEQHSRIKIYPNPTESVLNFQSTKSIDKITVYSLLGNVILVKPNTSFVDLSNFDSGIYLVNILTEFGNETLKIVKK